MPCTLTLVLLAVLHASGNCLAREQADKVQTLIEQVSGAAGQVRALHIKGHYSVSSESKTGMLVAGPTGRIEFELWRDGERHFVVILRQDEKERWTIGWNGRELVVVDHQRRQWASRRTNEPRNAPLLASVEDRDRLAQWAYMQIAGIWLVDASSYRLMLENAVRQATHAEITTVASKSGGSFRVLRIEGAQQSGSATMEQTYELYYDPRTLHLVRFVMTASIHAGPLRTRSRRILECEAVQTDRPIDAAQLEVRIPDGYRRAATTTHDAAQGLVGLDTRNWTVNLIYPEDRRQRFADFAGGKPVVCLVWATWCGPCKIAMRHLEALLDEDGTIGGVRVLTLGIDPQAGKLLDYARKHNLRLPVAHDPGFFKSRLNGAGGPPVLFFVDTGGQIVSAKMGYGPQLKPWLAEQIRQLRSGPQTPAEHPASQP